MERRDVVASQTLRAALTKAEQAHPGLSYDIVMSILKKGDLNVNLNESILRLQGGASETDRELNSCIRNQIAILATICDVVVQNIEICNYCLMFNLFGIYFYSVLFYPSAVIEYRLNRTEDAFQELNKKSASLKRILSRIPDEISDRKTFLETIKYVDILFQ